MLTFEIANQKDTNVIYRSIQLW